MGYGDVAFFEGKLGNIWVSVGVCVVSWEHTLDRLSHLLCHWTSPCSHTHTHTMKLIHTCTHSSGTHLRHLAQPACVCLRNPLTPAATGVSRASASHVVAVAKPSFRVQWLTHNLFLTLDCFDGWGVSLLASSQFPLNCWSVFCQLIYPHFFSFSLCLSLSLFLSHWDLIFQAVGY